MNILLINNNMKKYTFYFNILNVYAGYNFQVKSEFLLMKINFIMKA